MITIKINIAKAKTLSKTQDKRQENEGTSYIR